MVELERLCDAMALLSWSIPGTLFRRVGASLGRYGSFELDHHWNAKVSCSWSVSGTLWSVESSLARYGSVQLEPL